MNQENTPEHTAMARAVSKAAKRRVRRGMARGGVRVGPDRASAREPLAALAYDQHQIPQPAPQAGHPGQGEQLL